MLDELYPTTPVPLNHSSAYTLLVAVMLSAQTTDKKVNEVTPALFAKASTPEQMSKLDVDTIQALIREIGLAPTKAKNLRKMGQQLVEGHGMRADWDYLESLAGVGHKTASVVMAQWYGIPAFPVDTHIHRLAARWGLSKAKNVEQTERDLKILWPEETWNKRHLQIIFFGREFCPARNHNLSQCQICSWAATQKRIREEMRG
jgi:endonuclease-3